MEMKPQDAMSYGWFENPAYGYESAGRETVEGTPAWHWGNSATEEWQDKALMYEAKRQKRIRMRNAAWVTLCLVILIWAGLFALDMLQK